MKFKIRLRRLRFAACRNVAPKKRSHVEAAINGTYTVKTIPTEIREIMIEQTCLRLELKIMAACHSNKQHNSIAIKMAEKIRRIESIEQILKGREWKSR